MNATTRIAREVAQITFDTRHQFDSQTPAGYAAQMLERFPRDRYRLVSIVRSGDTGYVIGRKLHGPVTRASWLRLQRLLHERGVQPDLLPNWYVKRG